LLIGADDKPNAVLPSDPSGLRSRPPNDRGRNGAIAGATLHDCNIRFFFHFGVS
jgi:hypothetical protein